VKVEVYISIPISPQDLSGLVEKGTSLMVNMDIFHFLVKELDYSSDAP
jgi:hypothetical protein